MAEYIDREALLKQLEIEFKREGKKADECAVRNLPDSSLKYGHGQYCFLVAKTMVQDEPVADVVEVRHGKWLQTQEPMGWNDVDCIECSACHESWIMDDDLCLDDYKDGWKYCPNCGAKMDGKGDTTEKDGADND